MLPLLVGLILGAAIPSTPPVPVPFGPGERFDYVAKLDIAYGIVAGLVLVVGFSRVFFGIKGAGFYLSNPVFWAKMAAFLILGLLSIPPTMQVIRWRKAADGNDAFRPPDHEVKAVRRYMHYEGMAYFTIPVFAALMARGYGL